MPVTQLQDQGGIGQAIGMVGGYLLGNPARKAKQAQQDIENQRNSASDKRADAAAIDTHNRITSEIAKNTSDTANTTADRTNKDFQQGAYAKLSGMLNSPPPQGTTAQQWVTHIQSQVPTLGLTDPKLLTQLYGEAQGVLAKDQTTQNATFAGNEMALPSDPAKKLSVLMKRLQVEKGKPGFDLKPTETMISDTQKQITEAQAAASQAATAEERKRHNGVMEGLGGQRIQVSLARGSGSGGYNSDLQPRAQAIEQQAMGAKDIKGALKILETANLTRRDRTEVRQDIMDQFKAPPLAHDTSGLSNAGKEAFNHDVTAWATSGMDPEKQPDPADPKYQKRAAVVGTGGGAPSTGGGGEKKTVSLQAAMKLPSNAGKSPAQVQADIQSHGYTVAP